MTVSTTFSFDDSLSVHRLGFGAMRLTGHDRKPPGEHEQAVAVARRAVELGAEFIDTADSYGLGANEELLAEALAPYPDNVLIATKAGQSRPGGAWVPLGRPEYLRQQAELSLRRLRIERIELFQLHRIDPLVPLEDQFGALARLLPRARSTGSDCPRSRSSRSRPHAGSSTSRACRTATT